MIKTENFAKVEVASQQALREWLKDNHTQSEAVWLVTWKKHTGDRYISTAQVLDELLCFGWIDGIRRKLDDDRTMQLIAPRQAQHWSKTYKDRAARLIDEGKMQAAGLESIEASKQNGMWRFLDDVDALIVPDDLAEALAAQPGAAEFFNSLSPSKMRFALRWVKLAKSAEARARRIEKTALLSSQKKRVPGS